MEVDILATMVVCKKDFHQRNHTYSTDLFVLANKTGTTQHRGITFAVAYYEKILNDASRNCQIVIR